MRHRCLRSLGLSLGLLVAAPVAWLTPALRAEPPAPAIQPWPPAASSSATTPPTTPPSELAPILVNVPQPSAPASTPPAVIAEAIPAVSLERPVALRDKQAVVDGEVRPTSLFNRNSDAIAYSPAAGVLTARPLPPGPSLDVNNLPLPSATLSATPPPDCAV